MDPRHFDADPDADPDSTYHPNADPESDFYLIRIHNAGLGHKNINWIGSKIGGWVGLP